MDAILLTIGIVYGVCRIVIKSEQHNPNKCVHKKEMGNKMFKVHSYVRQNDSECRKWKVYREFTLHGFSYAWDMIGALIKRVSVTYQCYEMYAHRRKKVQLLVF
jgi:hypothetical protein